MCLFVALAMLAGCAGGGQDGPLSNEEHQELLSGLFLDSQLLEFSWEAGEYPLVEIDFWKDGTCYTEYYELLTPEDGLTTAGSARMHFGLMDVYITHGHLDAELTQLFITQLRENGDLQTGDVRSFPVTRNEKSATSGFSLQYEEQELRQPGRYLVMQTLFYAYDNAASDTTPQAAKPEDADCAVLVYYNKLEELP